MKRIGIVGGIGWQSTVEYYAGLCRRSEQWRARKRLRGGPLTPEICIESLDSNTAFALLGRDHDEESWRRFDEYHRTPLMRLQASDVEVAAIASNTPHHRYSSIVRGIGIPVLSILDAAADEAIRMGVSRVLILGTKLTMESKMYPETFRRYGIDAVSPASSKVRSAAIKIIEDLHKDRIEGTDARIRALAQDALGGKFPEGIAVCLACTELPLAFPSAKESPSFEQDGCRYINTTAAHIRSLFDYAST